jgi:hypothetical protein
MVVECSLPCPQELSTSPYPEPHEIQSTKPHHISVRSIVLHLLIYV